MKPSSIHRLKPRLLPALIFSLISGCGGGGGGTTAQEDTQDAPTNTVKTFTLCRDTNMNASCDAQESPQAFTDLASAIAASNNDQTGTVLLTGVDGTLLVGAPNTESASVISTLRYNESLYNPTTSADPALIDNYLKSKLFPNTNTLSESQQNDFIDSVKAAKSQYSQHNGYAVLAAVIDTAIEQGSLKNAIPSQEKVEKQSTLPGNYSSEPETALKAQWDTSDGDERVRFISPSNDKILIATRWHNRAVIIDSNTSDATSTPQPFAAIDGAGHNIESTNADYVSGASEHTMTHGWLNDTGDALYAVVAGPRGDTPDTDDSYGLFKVPLDNGQLPENLVASLDGSQTANVPHRAATVTRVDNAHIEEALPTSDDRVLAYDSEIGYVRVYDSDLNEDLSAAFELERELLAWQMSNNGSLFLLLRDKNDAEDIVIQNRSLTNLGSATAEIAVASDSDNLIGSANSQKLLIVGDKSISVRETSTLDEVAQIPLSSSASSTVAMSDNGSKAALSLGNNEITIVNLDGARPYIEGRIEYSGRLRAVAINGNDELLYSSSGGELQSVSLTLASQPDSIDDILESAMAGIDETSLNHEYSLDAVIYPLEMPTSLGQVDYIWNSTLGQAIVADNSANQGQVNQPAIGSDNISGALNVKAEYNFRGDVTQSEEKSFDVTVRAETPAQAHTITKLTGVNASAEYSKLAANADGTQLAGAQSATSDAPASVSIYAVESDGTVSAQLASGQNSNKIDLPSDYAYSQISGLVWSGETLRVVVRDAIASADADGNGQAAILSLDANSGAWTESRVLAGNGNFRTINTMVAVSQNQESLAIWQHVPTGGPDDEYRVQVKTYKASDLSEIAEILIQETYSFWALTVSNDGQHIMGYFNYRNADRQTVRETRRFSAGGDGTPSSQMIIENPTYGYSYDNDADRLLTADFDTELNLIDSALSSTEYEILTNFPTARGEYMPGFEDDHDAGRIFDLLYVDNTAYLWSPARGLIAVDISQPTAPKERFFAAFPSLEKGAVSADGKVLFSHGHSETESLIGVIKLDQAN